MNRSRVRSLVVWAALGGAPLAGLATYGCGESFNETCSNFASCGDAAALLDGSSGPDATNDTTTTGNVDGNGGDGQPSGDGGVDAGGDTSSGCGSTSLKACGGGCVSVDDPTYGCTPTSCTPCAVPNATAACAGGTCVVATCAQGFADCADSGTACASELNAPGTCGNCGTSCDVDGGFKCLPEDAGPFECTLNCPVSQPTDCNGSCVDTLTSTEYCGVCDAGASCATCAKGCASPPTGGTESCVVGVCTQVCPVGTPTVCDDTCVDTTSNSTYCGNCHTACTAPTNGTTSCITSNCTPACDPSFHLCGAGPSAVCDPNSDTPVQDKCVISETFGIFVSSLQGNDGAPGAGTRATPFKTIGAGLTAAKAAGKRLYVCADATYGEQVALADGVDMYGYFTCGGATWAVGATGTLAAVDAPGSPAVSATTLVKGAHVEGFAFTAPPGATAGASSIGVIVSASTGVSLAGDTITAGSGATGASGTLTSVTFPTATQLRGGAGSGATGGPGCSIACSALGSTAGGTGGPGVPPVGGDGSNGSSNPAIESDAGLGQSAIECTGGNGTMLAGASASPASDGSGGSGGTLSTSGWSPQSGTPGSPGVPGEGGGGGGGSATGAGGGGGCGGCGGEGGGPGGGGGASIALIVDVSPTLAVTNCTLTATTAGVGGPGVVGQPGQTPGGNGGVPDSNGGCQGGRGGAGGAGGAGGGGAGGFSVGLLVHGTPLTPTGGSITAASSVAAGGAGGNPSNPANAGVKGTSAPTLSL